MNIQLSNSRITNESVELPDIPKPKGAITAFNFYSKMARKTVLEEIGDHVRIIQIHIFLFLNITP